MKLPSIPNWVVVIIIAMSFAGTMINSAILAKALSDINRNRLENCEDVNNRHDTALDEFSRITRENIRKYPELAARIRDSNQSTVILIERLVPKRDCKEFILGEEKQ